MGKNRGFFFPNFWSGLGYAGVINLFEGPGIIAEVLGAPWGVVSGVHAWILTKNTGPR